MCVGAYFDPTQIYYTTEPIPKNASKSNKIGVFGNQNFLNMVGQNRGTTGTLQGTNRRGNLRPEAENRIFRGNLA